MTLPRLGTPTADDIDLQLRRQARLKGTSRVLRALGLMKLEDTPDVGLTNFKVQMTEAPQDILAGLRRLGRSPDSETFLRSLKPEIDEDGLTSIFGKLPPVKPPPISPVSARVTAPFRMPAPPVGELKPLAPSPELPPQPPPEPPPPKEVPTFSQWAVTKGFDIAEYGSMLRGRGVAEADIPEMLLITQKGLRDVYEFEFGLGRWGTAGGELEKVVTAEPQRIPEVAKVFGQSLARVPKQLGAAILQAGAGQGGASVVDKDWTGRLIEESQTDIGKFAQEISEKYPDSKLMESLAQLPQNIAFSLTSMGAGVITGVPVALLPVPGARVAAWGIGSAASGVVAYNMTTYQIMQQYLEAKNEEMIATRGSGITAEEEKQLKADFEGKARAYGLWEAVPEAISNLAFARILTAPLTRIAGRSIAARMVEGLTTMYGQELLTETITQKGQSAIEVEAGLREGRISWTEAFKEIAPQTFLLTTILGGVGSVSVASVIKVKQSLKTEIGADHPLYQTLLNGINERLTEVLQEGAMAFGGRTPTPESVAFKIAQGQALTRAEEQLRANNAQAVETALNQLRGMVTPEVTIPEGVRPNLYLADIEDMMPGTAKKVKSVKLSDGSELVMMSDEGDIYGLIGGKEVGFATKLSDTETDLSVVMEYRNKGIGTEIMRQFRIENPEHPTGGLTEGGRRVIEKLAIPKAEAIPVTPGVTIPKGYLARGETGGAFAPIGGTWATDTIGVAKGYGEQLRFMPEPKNPIYMTYDDMWKKYFPDRDKGDILTKGEFAYLKRRLQAEGYDAWAMPALELKQGKVIGEYKGAKDYWIFERPKLMKLEEIAIPKAEAGQPEAGLQPSMLPEGVAAREVRPAGKGRVTQISMDEQLRLEQARRVAEVEQVLQTEPVAQVKFRLGNRNVGLESFISIREQSFPEYFTVKQAQALFPGHDFSAYTQKGTPKYNRVPRDVALDDLTEKLNMTPDEIADRVMFIRQERQAIKRQLVTEEEIATTEPEVETLPLQEQLAGGEGGLRPPLTTLPPEIIAAAGEVGGRQPPVPPILASGIPDPLPSITPGPMAQNVIGLRTIQPGLTRQQTINNWMRRQFGKAYKKVGGRDLVLEDALGTPAIVERARVAPIIESQANDLAAKVKVKVAQTFKLDKQNRVPALADVIPEVGAPTIQDIAARLPLYANSLTPQELEVFSFLKESVQPYHDLMIEVGVELRSRADVMEGGFYLPRSFATLEDADLPYKVGGGRGGMKKGFEKPAIFDSMAQGIEAGYKYPSLSDAVANYARGAGQRATDAHVVNYMKALTDDTGNLLGETPKIRMLRQHPKIARPVEEIKANLVRLKSNIGALTQRQMDVIDLWANDPDFADTSAVIISLQEGLSTMKAGTPPQILRELRGLLKQNIDALKALKPSYDKAMREAQVTPREQGAINAQILPGLQGRTFPVELANAINIVLNQEGPLMGRGAQVMNITNAFNALWAMGHATADLSAGGIQGLLLLYNHPLIWSKAFYLMTKTLFSDKVAGEYLLNFDAREKKAGRLTSAEWNRAGSRMSGEAGFLETIGVSEKIMNAPIIKQSNRAFSLFGDVARKEWNSSELRAEMAKGRTLEESTASGDLERVSFGANVMTGWSSEGFGSSIGQTILFAPRWLQSRLSTLTLAAKGMRPGATKDQAMARNAILKLIAFGTLITVALNAVQDEETDFRLIVNGKRNPHFMRVKIPLESGKVEYVSLFGSWDSLVGMLTHIGTGRPLNALRNMGSGIVAVSFDIITGRDYQWREVGSKPVDPLKLSQWILRSSVPYAWGDLPETYKLFAEGEVIPGTLRLGGEALGIKSYIEEAQKPILEAMANLGKIDQFGLDAALKQATADKASPAKIAEIKAKDWTYDITSLRRDIGDAIQNLSDEDKAKLNPIAVAYSEFAKQKDAYEDLSDKEQVAYLKNNPSFVVNRVFWSDNGLTEIPDLATANAVTAKAQALNIPLNMIPAFQLTDKGKQRIPSDRTLWKAYFDYYALPGNGGYLSYSKEQVDAGKLPAKYLAEWQTYHKLKTDTAKTLFRKNHKEVSTDWREDLRRKNSSFDKWLIDQGYNQPLKPKATTRLSGGGVSQTSIALATTGGARGGFSGGVSVTSRRKAKYPKFRRIAVSRGLSISAPGAPRV